jgi:hypothetical protein
MEVGRKQDDRKMHPLALCALVGSRSRATPSHESVTVHLVE